MSYSMTFSIEDSYFHPDKPSPSDKRLRFSIGHFDPWKGNAAAHVGMSDVRRLFLPMREDSELGNIFL